MLALLALAIWVRGVDGKPLGAVAATVFGVGYTGGMLSFGYAIRYHEYAFAPATLSLGARTFAVASGGLLLLLPVLVTWASDIGAYAVGRTMGRHKLIPSVSPGKTVEGAIGGLLASMLVAWAVRAVRAAPGGASRLSTARRSACCCSARSSASPRRSAISPNRCSSARPA